MRVLKFDTENSAKQWDWDDNDLQGSISRYRFARKPLVETVTLSKAEYAADQGIPQTIEDFDGVSSANPNYTALEDSYTLNRYALMVGDALDTVSGGMDDAVITLHPDVVTIEESDFYEPPEE